MPADYCQKYENYGLLPAVRKSKSSIRLCVSYARDKIPCVEVSATCEEIKSITTEHMRAQSENKKKKHFIAV